MSVRARDCVYSFNRGLHDLADIVRDRQTRTGRKTNVDLDEELVAMVVNNDVGDGIDVLELKRRMANQRAMTTRVGEAGSCAGRD